MLVDPPSIDCSQQNANRPHNGHALIFRKRPSISVVCQQSTVVCVGKGERLCFPRIEMLPNNGFSVCDSIRNRRNWDFVVKRIECFLKIWVVSNAVFELLTNDWYRTVPERRSFLIYFTWKDIRTDDPVYEQLRRFWTKIFAVSSSWHPSTVLVLEFEFACCLYLVGCVVFVNGPASSTPCSRRMSRIVQRSQQRSGPWRSRSRS